MDDIDLVNRHEEFLSAAREKVRKPEGPLPTGVCLWCEEPLEDKTHRWCDKDCMDDFELALQNAPHLIP